MHTRKCAPVPGVMPPVTARTNLATVTYPVVIASDSQRQLATATGDTIYNVEGPNSIDQFSILLTRKDTSLRNGAKHIPVFSRLNKIRCKSGPSKKMMRTALMKELRFAGVAFTGAETGNGDGTPSMLASVIGGSHTVMSYRSDHSQEPIRPGTMVRWTLPEVDENAACVQPPVKYHGASGKGVFAELEPVTPETSMTAVLDEILTGDGATEFKKHINCKCNGQPCAASTCKEGQNAVRAVLRAYASIQEREIGVVIQDSGKGSIDIRLK